MKFLVLLFLICRPIGGMAQTVAILNIIVDTEPHHGAKYIDVEVSMSNDKKDPVVLNNRFFYLQDDAGAFYSSLPRMNS